MLKDVIARNKAAEALGITIGVSRHWLSDGWPETISIKTLAKWQYPDDIASQDALIRTVKGLVASGRLPRRYVEPDYFAADNPPLSPWDVDDWFKRQNVEPCEHIKAWIDAAQPATEQKPNKQLIEWLNKAPAERGEFTDDMMKGVRVYKIIPPIVPYDDWLNRKQITLEEALMLSLGLNPVDPDDKDPLFFPQDDYDNRRNQAMQWMKSSLLHTAINREERDRDYYVKPLEFFRLAMANDWLDPLNAQLDPIIAFLEQNPTELKTETAAKPRTETATDDADRERTNNNDIAYSGLLKELSRKDAWFQVIDDMTQTFYKEFGAIPNVAQAWGRLWMTPPAGYEITTGTDKGEDCLKMPGVKALSQTAFAKRWGKYSRQ